MNAEDRAKIINSFNKTNEIKNKIDGVEQVEWCLEKIKIGKRSVCAQLDLEIDNCRRSTKRFYLTTSEVVLVLERILKERQADLDKATQ